jgi:hypothetical protein
MHKQKIFDEADRLLSRRLHQTEPVPEKRALCSRQSDTQENDPARQHGKPADPPIACIQGESRKRHAKHSWNLFPGGKQDAGPERRRLNPQDPSLARKPRRKMLRPLVKAVPGNIGKENHSHSVLLTSST